MTGALDSRVLFTVLVGLVALQRLVEVVVSMRHARELLAGGGVESGRGHLAPMIAMHVTFLIAAPAEVWLLGQPFAAWLGWPALALFALAQALRFWSLSTLGGRWTVRVIVIPGAPAITQGPYRFLRHPNYAAVAIEIAALPLVHSAWLTAVCFSSLNALLLAVRIRSEEQLLRQVSDYAAALDETPRFLPHRRGWR